LQIQIKSTIIIITVLLLGILLGSLSVRFFIHQRISDFQGMHKKAGFVHFMERVIDPDKAQAEEVRKILQTHFDHFSQLGERHRREVKALMDSLKTELEPYLTPDQLERLARHFERPLPPGGPPIDRERFGKRHQPDGHRE